MAIALPSRKVVSLFDTVPSWVLPNGPGLDIDFANGRPWVAGRGPASIASLLSVTRASQETVSDLAGNLTYAASGAAAISNAGLQVYAAATNIVLWNNDLSNAAWTASNITAAKDQAGPDNVANSASSIIATAGNGTILQAITLSSQANFQTAYVKRLVGTGVVNMTMDNGATWTAVTVTSGWTRVSIPTQTLANPTVGFQIVTNGDKIAVALVQNESGTFATPAIPTTTVSVTRAVDVITLSAPPAFGANFSLFISATPTESVGNMVGIEVSDGSTNNRALLAKSTTLAALNSSIGGVAGTSATSGTWTLNTIGKVAGAYQTTTQAAAFNGTSFGPATNTLPASSLFTTVRIGSNASSAAPFNGNITRIAIWPNTALPSTALVAMTQ